MVMPRRAQDLFMGSTFSMFSQLESFREMLAQFITTYQAAGQDATQCGP